MGTSLSILVCSLAAEFGLLAGGESWGCLVVLTTLVGKFGYLFGEAE